MKRKEVLVKLEGIFREVFDNQKLKINEDLKVNEIKEWDSLGQVMLIAAIMEDFKKKFSLKELSELKSVRAIIDAIIERNEN